MLCKALKLTFFPRKIAHKNFLVSIILIGFVDKGKVHLMKFKRTLEFVK